MSTPDRAHRSLPSLQDFYSECNNLNVPEDQFKMTFCYRCTQGSCSRSTVNGGGSFEDRAKNWEKRLFTEVPRRDPASAPEIAGKDFKETNLFRWADPHSNPKTSSAVPSSFTVTSPLPSRGGALSSFARANTPNPGPTMLPGAPQQQGTSEKVVRPGATIKMDD